jgi:DNA-binding CsgD family transcriptional regulator
MLNKHNQALKDAKAKRAAKIAAMRASGKSVTMIADKLGISRQRVLQLIASLK